MAGDEDSAATDLGKLLRDSLNDEVELAAKNTASIPVQLAPTPSTVPTAPSQHPASGIQMAGTHQPSASIPPLAPQLSTLSTPMKPLSLQPGVPVSPPKGSGAGVIIAVVVAVVLLIGAAGGGFAWYHAKHHAVVPTAPAPLPIAVTATPVAAAPEPEPAPPPTTTVPDDVPVTAPATPVATHHHHTSPPATTAPVASAPAAPPPKPASSASGVDAVLQQQLSGAIP